MLTADKAREMTIIEGKTINEKLAEYIDGIDAQIMKKARAGERQFKTSKGKCYNGELAKHYRASGFEVEHIVAPFDDITIRW